MLKIMPAVINFVFTWRNSHTWEKSPWFFSKRLGMYITEHASEKGHVCMYVCISPPPKQALKAGKKVKLSHEEVMQKMGELFALR